MDIKLNLSTKDVDLSTGGSIALTSTAEEALQQRLFIRMNMFRGEWFLDTDFGVPYFQKILGHGAKTDVIDAVLVDIILNTPDVASVDSFVSSLNTATREYSCSFLVTSKEGNQIKVTV